MLADGGFHRRTIYVIWSTGESKVDGRTGGCVCHRLARFVGYRDISLEQTGKLAFITRFPDHMLVELQKLLNIHSMITREVISWASGIILCCWMTPLAATVTTKINQARSVEEGPSKERVQTFKGQCSMSGFAHGTRL